MTAGLRSADAITHKQPFTYSFTNTNCIELTSGESLLFYRQHSIHIYVEPNDPRAHLRERLFSLLARRGLVNPSVLVRELGVSQPTFSRLVSSLRGEVLSFGRTRDRRYGLAREIPGVRQPLVIYEVRPRGEKPRRFGSLSAIGERGFYFASDDGGRFFDDLPWFLQGARPSGFLGRLVPQRHPELGLPSDIRMWSADHALRFASRYGWDQPGAFIIGDEACSRFLEEVQRPSNSVDVTERQDRYPAIASDLLSFGTAGSSAAGEQPKFLATRRDGDHVTPVLVKFSPPTDESVGRRVADLLVAEQVALSTVGKNGFNVPIASILPAGNRLFLEIERFDRDQVSHRTGQVALEFLDAQFAGTNLTSWTAAVEILAAGGIVPGSVVRRVRWLETFGRLIGNTDMHFGNLAFLLDGQRVTTLAPVYDMLPMHYHPRQGELPRMDHVLLILGPEVADVAGSVLDAAIDFWGHLADDSRVSESFREIAARNLCRTVDLRPRVESLPVTTAK